MHTGPQEGGIEKKGNPAITPFLHGFGIEKSQAVNRILSLDDSSAVCNESIDEEDIEKKSTIHTWEEIIWFCLQEDYTYLPLIKLNGQVARKFYLLHLSQIDINNLDEEIKKNLISQIANKSITEDEFRKMLNHILGIEDSNHEDINKMGAINLTDMSPFMFDNYSYIPRIVKLTNGNYISIEKKSETGVGIKVYTIRFGIKKDTISYPIFTGIANLLVQNQSFHFTKLLGIKNTDSHLQNLEEFRRYLSQYYSQDTSISLQPIKKGRIGRIGDGVIRTINQLKGGFYKANIFDAGINEKGHKVLLVQSINENEIFSQLEMTLFFQDGKNIIYIGALGKDGTKEKFIKSIPGLLAQSGDIIKLFDRKKALEIWSFKASRDGTGGTMRKDTVSKIIQRYTLKGHKMP